MHGKPAQSTFDAINRTIEARQESGFRRHLGGSVIGRSCGRQLWYAFRWAGYERFDARKLRLFDRGQREEERFTGWLRDAGMTVWTEDENGDQFRIADHKGHFGGSLDGVAKGVPDLPPDTPCLVEMKTHNDKSFKLFRTKPVFEAKPEHYVQMQIYMLKSQLQYALYMAINKNDDDIYLEIVQLDPVFAQQYLDRAGAIIFASEAPPRISKTTGWYECGWCIYKAICHNDGCAKINCRTCAFSTPVEKKKWSCSRFDTPRIFRSKNVILSTGCDKHIFLPDMIGGAKLVETDPNKEFIKLKRFGETLLHGPNHVRSKDLVDDVVPF